MNKCLYCGKKTNNKKFCSRKCMFKYFKKHKIGAFHDPEIQSLNRKKGHETQKRLKKGIWNSKARKKGHEIQKKLKKGFWNPETGKMGGKASQETLKRLKISAFYNPELQSKFGKIGGLASVKARRKNKPYYFHKVPFDSNFEKEIGMNISYQLGIILKERLNCHILVGGKEIDFFIKDCFIEVHTINYFFNKYYKNNRDYYLKRRKILDKNGYKKYKLIVIK